jgi:hypothetical protein
MSKFLFIISLLLVACGNYEKPGEKNAIALHAEPAKDSINTLVTNVWVDRLTNRKYPLPDSIGNRPVKFYLDDSTVATIAKDFYKGLFRPTDNDSTGYLLSLVATDDSITRPFYRWALDFTIQISDGALAEYPGKPALDYAITYPLEFFNYMDKDASGERYKRWTGIISYSGLYDYTQKAYTIQYLIEYKMIVNCKGCSDDILHRIKSFSTEITSAFKDPE